MAADSIVAEVRQARDALAKRFNYDLRAILQDARERQAAGGRKVVSFPPRQVKKSTAIQVPNPAAQPTGVAGRS